MFTLHIWVHVSNQVAFRSRMLFDFDIKYRAGKTNQAADALSQQPVNPNDSSESSDGEEEWETISYEMVCQILDYHLDSSKLPCDLKHEVQVNTYGCQ